MEAIQLAANTEKSSKKTETTTKKNADTVDVDLSQTETTTESNQFNISLDNFEVDLANPTWDLLLIGFFILSVVLYGFSLGRDRIIMVVVSIYMALAVVNALPDFVLNIAVGDNLSFEVTAFVSIFIVLFFLLSRSALMRTLGANASNGKIYQTLLLSILHVGLLVSVTLTFLPPQFVDNFSPLTQYIFTDEWTSFAWIAGPILAMAIFGGGNDAPPRY